MIELKNIHKVYNEGKPNSVHALRGLDLAVGKGESIAVMGVSGSGKSTLLHIIGCLDTPTEGSYLLDGKEVSRLSEKELARLRNACFGFVLQDYGLIMNDTVVSNVTIPLLFNKEVKRKDRERLALRAIETVGLTEYTKTKVGKLSGGQRQRVAIARAIANDPGVILADEPTAALDSTTANEIMEALLNLNRAGKTIILVTHDINMANKMGRIVHIADGVIEETVKPSVGA